MSVTVVVGGQYGSEGKGKVAQYLAAENEAGAVIRIGGSNSGHTGFSRAGERRILRQLPTAALLPDVLCVLGPGSYIDVDVLLREVAETELTPERLLIDEKAFIITQEDREAERRSGQETRIGSTTSGTGASVARRITRRFDMPTVRDIPALKPFLSDTATRLRSIIDAGVPIIIEGTQGFGLSLLHSPHYPYVTSRDTSASAAVAEAGLSPRDVDAVVLVLRTFPIRVGGNSGPLPNEIDWQTLAVESDADEALAEYTSVTGRLRRVARFDPEIVRRAIAVNLPSMIVLNHIDYVDAQCAAVGTLTERARRFVDDVSESIGADIDLVGLGPTALVDLSSRFAHAVSVP